MATVSSGCGGVKDGFPLIDRSHHDAEAETEAFSWRSSCSLFCSHGGGSRKVAAAAIDEDKFSPIGLHVLVVDSDTLCLAVLERMLRLCDYNVTACTRVSQAISFVMENRHSFDIVITDVHLPGEDGFKLLEVVGIGFGLPVIMMSTNGATNVVMRSITGGASDYLIKPIRMEELSTIWQHVVRRHRPHYHHHNIKDNHGDWSVRGRVLGKSKKGKQSCGQVIKDLSSLKTARVHWTAQLHRQFVKAVNQTGLDNAAPKRILEIMNIEGLTRENVASHLQKYRLYLMRLSGSNWESRPVASFQAARNGKSSGTMQIRQHAKTTPSSSLLSSSSSVLKETASYRSTNVHVDQGYESGAELHKITYVGWLRKNLQGGGGHRASPVHAYSAAQSSKVNFTELEETKPLPKLLGPSAHQPQLIQCAAPTAKTLEENGVDKEKVQRSIDQEELLFNNLVEEEFFCVKVPPDLDQMPTLIAAAGNLSEEGYFMFGDALLLKPG